MVRRALLLAAGVLAWIGSVVAVALLLDGYPLGLVQGGLLVAGVALVRDTVRTLRAAGPAGASGPADPTGDVLRSETRRRHIHGSVERLQMRGGDVDHLVATRAGWVAVETRFHHHDIVPDLIRRDAEAARSSARWARSILHSESVEAEVTAPVRPVVVVWGGHQDDVPRGGRERDGVLFLRGRELAGWLGEQRREKPVMRRREARQALGRLEQFRERVRDHDLPQVHLIREHMGRRETTG